MSKINRLSTKLVQALEPEAGFKPEACMILYDRTQVNDLAEILTTSVSGEWKFLSNLLVLARESDAAMILLMGYEFAEIDEETA